MEQNGFVLMSQKQIIFKVLHATGEKNANAVGSPLDISILASSDHKAMLSQDDKTIYLSLAKRFMYLASWTSPDLNVAASMMDSDVNEPTQSYMVIVHRTLRYLRETMNTVLRLKPGYNDQLRAYIDAAWDSEAIKNKRSSSRTTILFRKTPTYAFIQ